MGGVGGEVEKMWPVSCRRRHRLHLYRGQPRPIAGSPKQRKPRGGRPLRTYMDKAQNTLPACPPRVGTVLGGYWWVR
ncbi:hypothetical protein EON64_04155 [archaeon]|nr:MAG: hypothetical protein EON64_04155 [archaeon]